MLLFRSEEHVGRWRGAWGLHDGESFSTELCWRLARSWFDQNRGDPSWRRRTPAEAEAVFASLGLTSSFWRLT